MRGRIHIGTSGWHYAHWVGPFYPSCLHSDDFLSHYARSFRTVEINNTFYHLPETATLEAWRDETPPGFVFACKASRYITHMKKLREPARSTARFLEAVRILGDKLGPILFQLPPRWHANAERLEDFLQALPDGLRYAFEFRDESWFTPRIYQVLARHDAALCAYDLMGWRSPAKTTAGFVYLRLHGPCSAYGGNYGGRTLRGWARRLLTWRNTGLDVYCYFNNDQGGYAVQNARHLVDMVAEHGSDADT